MTDSINIGFLVYPDVFQLDVMAAYQILSFPRTFQIKIVGMIFVTSKQNNE